MICEQCGLVFEPKRPHARYCSDPCRLQGNIERNVLQPGERVTHGVGSRGGNVHSVEEARGLHEQHKAEWTAKVAGHIGSTLISTGYFHADDLQPLHVPEAHSSVIGSQIASYVNRKLMVKVGERRCEHKAANGRKAAIYQVTDKGRKTLVGSSADTSSHDFSGFAGEEGHASQRVSTASGERSADVPLLPDPAPAEPARLFDAPPPPTAYDPFSEAA